MHDFRWLENTKRCHWSHEFQKNQEVYFSENRARGILGPQSAIQAL